MLIDGLFSHFRKQKDSQIKNSIFTVGIACVGALLSLQACQFDTLSSKKETRTTWNAESPYYGSGPSGGFCIPPSNQLASFLAPVEVLQDATQKGQIRVLVDRRFSQDQINAIEKAVETWNGFSSVEMGRPFFYVEVDEKIMSFDSLNGAENEGECEFDSPQDGLRIVVNDSMSRWKLLGLTLANPAVTLRCKDDGKLLKQIVMVQPGLANPEQWQSIMLHELGHVVGLNHSCTYDQDKKDSYAQCDDLDANHAYYQAVMYPSLQIGSEKAETKENLRLNDQERVKCLYY